MPRASCSGNCLAASRCAPFPKFVSSWTIRSRRRLRSPTSSTSCPGRGRPGRPKPATAKSRNPRKAREKRNSSMPRHDGRKPDDLRPVTFTRHYTSSAPGSVLVEFGRTKVLCTASIAHEVPKWLEGKGQGWVTAEYGMLPGSTEERKPRERSGKVDGRTSEIQRLIGR